jgi:glutamine cyclotransferase
VPLSGPAQPDPAVYSYRIINEYPHDPGAYTQGLVYENGLLYEGTGIWGQSTLRKGVLETGEILQSYSLPEAYFGEGITIWEDRIIQLTWKAGRGFVYDREGFDLLDSFEYATEGWGITHDGANLIMSDGTATLHIWDPETFQEVGQVQVQDPQGPVFWLNELEYVQGKIYAHVYQTDRVAMIEPETGQVTGWIDLGGLLEGTELLQPVDVLNGMAYDAENDRLFVTGKWWPKLFEIELIPAADSTD